MAAPTPTIRTLWNGRSGIVIWHAVWATGDQHTDSVVIDASALSKANAPLTTVSIRRIYAAITGDIQVILEWDATTDDLLWRFDSNADATNDYEVVFQRPIPDPKGTAATGDVVLSTLNCASGDEIMLMIDFERDT